MDAGGAQLVVFTARQEALGVALVDDEDNFGGDLRAQEGGFLHAGHTGVFPIGEVLGGFDGFDRCGALAEAAVALV